MSDEMYDAAGGISRYLQMTPSLESHVLALPDDGEPVATHVVGAPQHVPAVQGAAVSIGAAVAVAVPTAAALTPLNLSTAFGGFGVQNHHAMTMDDVQPMQGQYGFPADQIRALPARLDDVPSFEPTLEHGALPELLATMSLDDHCSMDDGDYSVEALFKSAEDAHSSAVAEDSVFPALNAAHTGLELDMLKEILSAPSSNNEAVGVPQSGPEAPHQTVTRAEENTYADVTMLINAANLPVSSPAIVLDPAIVLESSQVHVQNHGMSSSSDANAPGSETLLAKQRRRISQMTMKDIANLMHMSKKDAAKELNISVTSLKRLCRKNNNGHWPSRQIKSLDSQIKKLELAARTNRIKGLLAIKEKIDKLQSEKTQIYASVLKAIEENQQKHNDSAGGSRC